MTTPTTTTRRALVLVAIVLHATALTACDKDGQASFTAVLSSLGVFAAHP